MKTFQAITIIMALQSTTTFADVIRLYNESNQIIGANNIIVDNISYDVRFKDDTFNNIFGSGLNPNLDATTSAKALKFGTALQQQVFNISFNSVYGITNSYAYGYVLTPFARYPEPSSDSTEFAATFTSPWGGSYSNYVNWNSSLSASESLTNISDLVYADWTITPSNVVPIPAAAWLFGSALVGLAGVARREKI